MTLHVPRRIQRKRTKGWRMPENTVYVGRPGKWGNPFVVGHPYTQTQAVVAFHKMLHGHVGADLQLSAVVSYARKLGLDEQYAAQSGPADIVEKIKAELRGKNLACFCRLDLPCHADVLLEIANAD